MKLLDQIIPVKDIYVPLKRRKEEINLETVNEISDSILEVGQLKPILIRKDKERYILVDGLYRLEACKALGQETITAIFVQARKY